MKSLNQKIIYTVITLTVARIGIFIPVPGIDHDNLYDSIGNNALVNFLNIFSGGGLSTIGIFALGIIPYINASIITQLCTKIIPYLEKLQKEEGEAGRRKITQITRYLTLFWSIMQSFAVSLWIKPYVFNWDLNFIIDCTVTLTTGSIIIMWLSELITEYGIGNGASLLIFQNIVSGIPKSLPSYSYLLKSEKLALITICFLFICMLAITILIQEGTKKISIISAKQLNNTQNLNSKSYIPLKINQGGVMPIIFASAAMTMITYVTNSINYHTNITSLLNSPLYMIIYGFLIVIFSYFYASIILNPDDIAKNLKKMGASVPGFRPGNKTSKYLQYILNRLTFLGSMFLFLIALIPSIITNFTDLKMFQGLGATSLLILVGVAIDTAKQIQTYIISEKYNIMIQ
uniref:Protein translocase subunit SecY n=1 Tax=Porolithon onkodes TaxID=231751 RepID=A0A2Z2KXN0_9FLOR|nr:protein translocase subunit SecY [Porolithon onkodes]ASB29702.1 protein translocase subunit SecY [Porolithon onkodes]